MSINTSLTKYSLGIKRGFALDENGNYNKNMGTQKNCNLAKFCLISQLFF